MSRPSSTTAKRPRARHHATQNDRTSNMVHAMQMDCAAGRLRRFKQITETLEKCFITAGWQESYRKEEANRLLRYLERRAKGSGYHGKTENELSDFLYIHGQSIDFLYDGRLSGMFSHAAADSAVATVIRENRRGVSDQWSAIEKNEAERRSQKFQQAKKFMGIAHKRAKPAA